MHSSLIVSPSGIRGIVGESMTPEVAARYGAAFGQHLREADPEDGAAGPVLVARDSRTSGELLLDAASAGLSASGLSVADAGVVPTPTLLLAVRDDPLARGGLIVTASHNPVEWNGLKLASREGRFLPPAEGVRVQAILESGPRLERWGTLGDRRPLPGAAAHHVRRIVGLEVVDVEAIRAAAPLVAVDCVHGAAGILMPRLLEALGCRIQGLGLQPDGLFPRSPEPLPENLSELGDLVRGSGAELGLAVDPDGDRLALVDGDGRAVGEDWTLALAAEYVLSLRKGPVVTNLSSSLAIEDVAVRAGVPFYRTPVGEARVAEKMLEVGATIGGEGNGGVMLPDLNVTRDAGVAAALILSLLARGGARLEELLAGRPRYHMVKRKRDRPGGQLEEVYRTLLRDAPPGAAVDLSDGVRLAWNPPGEWVHIRASGTEPILRIISESAERERAADLARWAADRVGAAP